VFADICFATGENSLNSTRLIVKNVIDVVALGIFIAGQFFSNPLILSLE